MTTDLAIDIASLVLPFITFFAGLKFGERHERKIDKNFRVQEAKKIIGRISNYSITYYLELSRTDITKGALEAKILSEFQNLGRSLIEIDRRGENQSSYDTSFFGFQDSITDSPFRETFDPLPSTDERIEKMRRSSVPLLEWLDHVVD